MRDHAKIRLLNKLMAAHSPFGKDFYADAAKGLDMAIVRGEAQADLSDFAKKLLRVYDPDSEIEVLNFGDGFFDPLFALPMISGAAKRLSGYRRAILVVNGLDSANIPDGGRTSKKRRQEHAGNVDLVEDYVMRYQTAFPNLEIIFL